MALSAGGINATWLNAGLQRTLAEGLPELELDIGSGVVRQGMESSSTASGRIESVREVLAHSLSRGNTSMGPVVAGPVRLGASAAPQAPNAPLAFAAGADSSILLFQAPLDTGGNPIEAFEVFVE